MQLINSLTDSANQQFTIIGALGQQISFNLRYLPTQQSWMFSVSYLDFAMNDAFLVISPNVLRQWRNIINFGLLVSTVDGFEPQGIEDFVTGRIKIYLLNQAEVDSIEVAFFS